jgi:hypothetical protein
MSAERIIGYNHKKLNGFDLDEGINGKLYKFTQGDKAVYVPSHDAHLVDGFVRGMKKGFFDSTSFNLSGDYNVEEINGKYYRFTKGDKDDFPEVVYVPASEIDAAGLMVGGRRKSNRKSTKKSLRKARATKKASRNRRRSSKNN